MTAKIVRVGQTRKIIYVSKQGPAGSNNAPVPTKRYTDANHQLSAADAGCLVDMRSASPRVLTIPAEGTDALIGGFMCGILRSGAGDVTIQAAPGVTLNGVVGGSTQVTAQWDQASVHKSDLEADTWTVAGGVNPVA